MIEFEASYFKEFVEDYLFVKTNFDLSHLDLSIERDNVFHLNNLKKITWIQQTANWSYSFSLNWITKAALTKIIIYRDIVFDILKWVIPIM